MTIITQTQSQISAAIGVLMKRRGNTTDAQELMTINDAIGDLNDEIMALDGAELSAAAACVTEATDTLERVVASATIGPFDGFLSEIESAIRGLQGQQSQIHDAQGLPSANDTPAAAPALAAAVPPIPPVPAHSSGFAFADLQASYDAQFAACVTAPARQTNVDAAVARLKKGQDVYAKAGSALGIPWFFVGILHGMESGFNFGTHLHNGDPLTARTTHVPAGRPVAGTPPFTWLESAQDALILEGFQSAADWSIARVLYRFELFNGMGYRRRGTASPYLWSFSDQYGKGKFVKDGVFDPDAVSQQCGAAVMLKALSRLGPL